MREGGDPWIKRIFAQARNSGPERPWGSRRDVAEAVLIAASTVGLYAVMIHWHYPYVAETSNMVLVAIALYAAVKLRRK
jgi:hypothetical protein